MWYTGNAITNALYIGIVPGMRYVVLTDALISKLKPEQVEAVYAHEAGHGVRRHTLLFMLLGLGLVLGAHSIILALGGWLGMVGFLIGGLTQYNLGDAEVAIVWWATVGLMLRLATFVTEAEKRDLPEEYAPR